jgi:chromosome partitioning protein
MAAQVVTVAQQKGGAGKTTLALHLGACWAGQGRRVALLDIDPQGSLTEWFRLREERGVKSAGKLDHRTASGWRTSSEIDRLKAEHDVIIIDSPPHAETEAKVAIRAASMLLVPAQLSPMDLRAARPTIKLAQSERTPWLLVLNRVPARGALADAMRAEIAAQGLAVAQHTLGNRTLFASSLISGKGVTEAAPQSLAAAEITAVADEIWARLAAL